MQASLCLVDTSGIRDVRAGGANFDPTTVTKMTANDPPQQRRRRGKLRTDVLRCGPVTARVRPWARSERTAFLIVSEQPTAPVVPTSFGDTGSSPPGSALADWVTVLSKWGYSSARTNAVGPDLASWFADGGFTVCQHLALLKAAIGGDARSTSVEASSVSPGQVRSCHGRVGALTAQRSVGVGRSILEIDRASFPEPWVLDEQSLRDAVRATPASRIFHVDAPQTDPQRRPRMVGFLIVGLAGKSSYIQRLAVHPEQRRHGVARTLLMHGIDWSRARGCTHAVVNTEIENLPALALYEQLGFRRMDHDLRVMEAAW